MESAEADSKVRGRDLHSFLMEVRSHLKRLLAIILPLEDSTTTVKLLELMEMRVRCGAGKSADVKANGLAKIRSFASTDMVCCWSVVFLSLSSQIWFFFFLSFCKNERAGRRLLREGMVTMSEEGKKGKECSYWFYDDCFA